MTNCKRGILLQKSIERWFVVWVSSYSSKPFLEDDLFCFSMLGNGTSSLKDSSWTGIEASIIKWRFTYDMKLAMRPDAFSLHPTLEHMSEICLSKQSSEPVKTPSSVSFVLDLIGEPPKYDSVGVSELNKKCHFSLLFFIWLFFNQAYEMWNVILYIPNIPIMKQWVMFKVIFAIQKVRNFHRK